MDGNRSEHRLEFIGKVKKQNVKYSERVFLLRTIDENEIRNEGDLPGDESAERHGERDLRQPQEGLSLVNRQSLMKPWILITIKTKSSRIHGSTRLPHCDFPSATNTCHLTGQSHTLPMSRFYSFNRLFFQGHDLPIRVRRARLTDWWKPHSNVSLSLSLSSPSCRLHRSWKFCARSVLYMVNHVDDYAIQQLNEFDGSELKSTKREILNKVEDMKALSEPLTSLIKKVLADKVEMRR